MLWLPTLTLNASSAPGPLLYELEEFRLPHSVPTILQRPI